MFFVGMEGRQRLTAGRLLVVVRVVETPARRRHLSVHVPGRRRHVAALPRPMPRLARHPVDLLLARLGRLLPRRPHQLGEVAGADRRHATRVPVGSRRRGAARVPVRVVMAPLAPTQLYRQRKVK